jgi:hypothetical protein
MKLKTVLSILSLSALTFAVGYQVGQKTGTSELLVKSKPVLNESTSSASRNKLPHAWIVLDDASNDTPTSAKEALTRPEPEDGVDETEEPLSVLEDAFVWRDPSDIISMFNQLIELSEPQTDEDMRMFSQAIDQLRDALANNPTQLARMAEHLQSLEYGTKEFHYVTSLLQGLPDQKGRAALQNLALQLSQRTDSSSIQQFLHIVSNAQDSADNPEILSSLVNIALYSPEATQVKLEALDMVMPFQVSDVERQQILSGLNGILEQSEDGEVGAVLNHVMRFSNAQQRQEMAINLISTGNDIELRYTVIDGLQSGNIPRSADLKEQLFSIATNPSDPLHQQAKHALMYTFDISNQEYQRLKD